MSSDNTPHSDETDLYYEIMDFLCSSEVVRGSSGAERIKWLQRIGLERYQAKAKIDPNDPVDDFVNKLLSLIFETKDFPPLIKFLKFLQERHTEPQASQLAGFISQLGISSGGDPPSFSPHDYVINLFSTILGHQINLHHSIEEFCLPKFENHTHFPDGALVRNIPYTQRDGKAIIAHLDLTSPRNSFVYGDQGIGKSICRHVMAEALNQTEIPVLVVRLNARNLMDYRDDPISYHDTVVLPVLKALLEKLERYTRFRSELADSGGAYDDATLARYYALCDIFPVGARPALASSAPLDPTDRLRERLELQINEQIAGYKREADPGLHFWLQELDRVVRKAGFAWIYFILDRLNDERKGTVEEQMKALQPLLELVNHGHEDFRIAWKFFLDQQLRDKIETQLGRPGHSYYQLEPWDSKDLLDMLDRHLSHYVQLIAPGAGITLVQLCAPNMQPYLIRLLDHADGLPARALRLLECLFTEGCLRATIPITQEVIEAVMNNITTCF